MTLALTLSRTNSMFSLSHERISRWLAHWQVVLWGSRVNPGGQEIGRRVNDAMTYPTTEKMTTLKNIFDAILTSVEEKAGCIVTVSSSVVVDSPSK